MDDFIMTYSRYRIAVTYVDDSEGDVFAARREQADQHARYMVDQGDVKQVTVTSEQADSPKGPWVRSAGIFQTYW